MHTTLLLLEDGYFQLGRGFANHIAPILVLESSTQASGTRVSTSIFMLLSNFRFWVALAQSQGQAAQTLLVLYFIVILLRVGTKIEPHCALGLSVGHKPSAG